MVRKLFFTLAWLGILALSLGGIYLSIFPKYFYLIDLESWVFRGPALAISIFYLLIFIEKLLMNFEKSVDYNVKTENGKLVVSSASINNLVREVVSNNPDFKNIKTKNKIKGKKLFILITVDSYLDTDIAKDVEEVQLNVKSKVKEYLSLDVEAVEIKVSKVGKRKGSNVLPERGDI